MLYECINLIKNNSLFIEFLQNSCLQHSVSLYTQKQFSFSMAYRWIKIWHIPITLQLPTQWRFTLETYHTAERLMGIFTMIKARWNSGILKGHSYDPIKHYLDLTVYFIYFENGKLILKSFYRIYIFTIIQAALIYRRQRKIVYPSLISVWPTYFEGRFSVCVYYSRKR